MPTSISENVLGDECTQSEKRVTESVETSGLIIASACDVRGGRARSLHDELEFQVSLRHSVAHQLHEIELERANATFHGAQDAFSEWLASPEGVEAVKRAQGAVLAHDAVTAEMLRELERVAKIREYRDENLICVNGRAAVAGRLANITTYTGIINYGAVGTSTADPDVADPQLGTEIARTTVATSAQTTFTAYVNFLFTMASFNGTAYEFGTFIDGTGSANSGRIWTHVEPVSPWAKSSTEALVVACTYPFTYVP